MGDMTDHRDAAEPTAPRQAKVLTVSDGVSAGTREDLSGPAIVGHLGANGFEVVEHRVCPDGTEPVALALANMAYRFSGLIVTTGGTGFGPRDRTPEGTRRVLDRRAAGLSEAMRLVSPLGRLSRGISGTRGETLILNVAGSPTGAIEMLDAVLDIIPHALDLMLERPTSHPAA